MTDQCLDFVCHLRFGSAAGRSCAAESVKDLHVESQCLLHRRH
jgi:hypothetical protein